MLTVFIMRVQGITVQFSGAVTITPTWPIRTRAWAVPYPIPGTGYLGVMALQYEGPFTFYSVVPMIVRFSVGSQFSPGGAPLTIITGPEVTRVSKTNTSKQCRPRTGKAVGVLPGGVWIQAGGYWTGLTGSSLLEYYNFSATGWERTPNTSTHILVAPPKLFMPPVFATGQALAVTEIKTVYTGTFSPPNERCVPVSDTVFILAVPFGAGTLWGKALVTLSAMRAGPLLQLIYTDTTAGVTRTQKNTFAGTPRSTTFLTFDDYFPVISPKTVMMQTSRATVSTLTVSASPDKLAFKPACTLPTGWAGAVSISTTISIAGAVVGTSTHAAYEVTWTNSIVGKPIVITYLTTRPLGTYGEYAYFLLLTPLSLTPSTAPVYLSILTPSVATRTTCPNAPTITSITPTHGPTKGKELITLTGTWFTNTFLVTFGTAKATTIHVNSTGAVLTVKNPPHKIGPVTVTVHTPAGSATTKFRYTTLPPTRQYPRDDHYARGVARIANIGRNQPRSRQLSRRQGTNGTYL